MGIGHSKFQEKYFTDIELSDANILHNDLEDIAASSKKCPNENRNLTIMRELMKNKFEYFLLDNLLLSVQFFENYDRDMKELRKNVDVFEENIKTRLQQHGKECLLPDTLHSLVSKNVVFKFKSDAQKLTLEPLHSQRMIISPDNIKVYSPTEVPDLDEVPSGLRYTMQIEETNLQGYVRLNLKSTNFSNISEESSIDSPGSSTPTPGEIFLNEIQTKIDLQSQTSTPSFKVPSSLNSTHSSISDDDSFDDVFKSNFTKTERRLSGTISKEMLRIASQSKSRNLKSPKLRKPPREQFKSSSDCYDHCITSVDVKNLNMNIYEEIDHDRSQKRVVLFETKRYFNALMFANSFGDMFSSDLGNVFGFSNDIIAKSLMQRSIIYSKVNQNNLNVNFEIIPSVSCAWPDVAYEWIMRDRPMLVDTTTEMTYRWPTKKMVERITKLPCFIYPLGCLAEDEEIDTDFPLQWRLMFPSSEKFLETCLTHTQMRCYLFILAFYKTILEPRTSKLGLTEDHIRSLMFWECERNYLDWNEERLGEKLLYLFKKLRQHLQNQNQSETLRDYFIPTRNLFENTPIKYLLVAQRSLADIIENPVMFTLNTLKNLSYTNATFYPTLNYSEIYSIITAENILEKINPNIRVVHESTTDSAFEETSSEDDDEDDCDETSKWNKQVYEQIQEEKRKIYERRRQKVSRQSINVNVKLIGKTDSLKLMLLLKIFIDHFINMAKKCYTYECFDQGLMYVQHAENLTILLREETQDEVGDFFQRIKDVEQQIQNSLFEIRVRNLPAHNRRATATTSSIDLVETAEVTIERYTPLEEALPLQFAETQRFKQKDYLLHEETLEECYESIGGVNVAPDESGDEEIESSHV